MNWLRIALFMLGGVVVMSLCLLWVSQFFDGEENVTPVIWIEDLRQDARESDKEPFAEWQKEEE